jgi:hypothetical protein
MNWLRMKLREWLGLPSINNSIISVAGSCLDLQRGLGLLQQSIERHQGDIHALGQQAADLTVAMPSFKKCEVVISLQAKEIGELK